ncbi:AraC family transcriptional regulator [Cohnella sp. JJ-181]|uniref:AraC family transcriptional regulator n=1 Tax=Cohnella rhizoplanae TaxID=2974897 RepID=UPI0022FF878F|nr:AraC family transcriptional regulator [Cohnella sp. JJ-181]CAI6060651.1 HTH-type transcriptional activator RhaR [Cohnella sp. JJ-181]
MAYMDIPYGLDDQFSLPELRFRSIWKVQANRTYQAAKPLGFDVPGIFVTFEGRGTLSQSDARYELEAGTYMIVQPGLPCAYRCADDLWNFYFIHFEPLDMALLLDLTAGRPASSARMAEAVRLCERMIDSLIVRPKGYKFMVNLEMQKLLLLFATEQDAGSGSRYSELDDILYRMHKNIGQPAAIDDLVRQSGLSRTVFFARFRARTGMSPHRYMQELKLASAKTSLETTNLSVKEIAAALQFYDEFQFSKLFKQRYGASPRAYRQR